MNKAPLVLLHISKGKTTRKQLLERLDITAKELGNAIQTLRNTGKIVSKENLLDMRSIFYIATEKGHNNIIV